MTDQEEPSAAVATLLTAGRYIDAVKHVREERNLGLKEAKAAIDDYLQRYPARFPRARRSSTPTVALRIVLLGLAVLAAFVLGARFG